MDNDVRPAVAEGVPFLSIVIPCYNRERLIRRAIGSCLTQDYADFEVIVVDDGSTDGTAASVEAYSDPRVRLMRHAVNRGHSPARNTGIAAAHGEWILTFDSDDELLPGALSRMRELADDAPGDIARLAFMHRFDDGRTSPPEPFADEVWDYEGYLHWREECGRQIEFLYITRHNAFVAVRYPDNHTWETMHFFDFARRFKTRTLPEYWLLRHTDAPFQSGQYRAQDLIPHAIDHAASFAAGLKRHGPALLEHAPRTLRRLTVLAMNFAFLAGDRAAGRHHALEYLKRHPLDLLFWPATVLGALGPRAYANGLNTLWRLRGVLRRS